MKSNQSNRVFAYIRVSTPKQGEGVSLEEQRDAIERYAKQKDFIITSWYKEQKSATRSNRPQFLEMVEALRDGKASGVIMHKIDRSTRNLRDWVELIELFEGGIAVHFAHEHIDLSKRGGRLAADIQAVIATDYVRNLREECIKGIYGRLKQGIYPFKAPPGYLDTGGGNVKELDPLLSPLILQLFEAYARGNHSATSLHTFAEEIGVRDDTGRVLSVNQLRNMLKNRFYIGYMDVKGASYEGKHTPLVPLYLFNKVQEVMGRRCRPKSRYKNNFLFQRMVVCGHCKYSLVGEKQKRWIYYRCHTKRCPTTTIREDRLERQVCTFLKQVRLPYSETEIMKHLFQKEQRYLTEINSRISAFRGQIGRISKQEARLTSLFISGDIEQPFYDTQKQKLAEEKEEMESKIIALERASQKQVISLDRMVALAQASVEAYQVANQSEKGQLVRSLFEKMTLTDGKINVSQRLDRNTNEQPV